MLKRAIPSLLFIASAAVTLPAQSADTVAASRGYWKRLTAGAATSILIHEMAHVGTSLAYGARPTFGFDKGRPTVYSGIYLKDHPREQFLFSAAGLSIQSLLDEALLDIPHDRGGAFERGLLAGGVGTTVFYLTIGRWGSVSDVDFMARTHVMNKTQITLLFGSIAALHSWRISRDSAYANFFARPGARGFELGVVIPSRRRGTCSPETC